MLALLLGALLVAVGMASSSAQRETVPVTFAWGLEATHEPSQYITWELEVDGTGGTPCTNVTVTESDRRCTSEVASGAHTFRLRGTLDMEAFCTDFPDDEDCPPPEPELVGEWSAPLQATTETPGTFTIRSHEVETMAIGDTFVVATDTALSSHSSTGPNGGFEWQLFASGGIRVIDADDVAEWSTSGFPRAVADGDVGSSDMRVSVSILVANAANNGNNYRVWARVDPFQDDAYAYIVTTGATQTHRLFRLVGGSATQLESVNGNEPSPGDTITIEVEGDQIRGLVNGVERISVTDDVVTGGTRAGFGFGGGTFEALRVDDFFAEPIGEQSVDASEGVAAGVGEHASVSVETHATDDVATGAEVVATLGSGTPSHPCPWTSTATRSQTPRKRLRVPSGPRFSGIRELHGRGS